MLIRLIDTLLTDNSHVWGVALADGTEIDCISQDAAVELANTLERTTNHGHFDAWQPLMRAA